MFQSITHKNTVHNPKTVSCTYTFTVVDDAWTLDVSRNILLDIVIKHNWLSPLFVILAYQAKGLNAQQTLEQLDQYYMWLAREGHRVIEIRSKDFEWMRNNIDTLSNLK